MSGQLEHSALVDWARKVYADTAITGDGFGDVVMQNLELRRALEQLLAASADDDMVLVSRADLEAVLGRSTPRADVRRLRAALEEQVSP